MKRSSVFSLLCVLPTLVLCACVPPRATIVEKAPEPKKEVPVLAPIEEPVLVDLPEDDLRLPDEHLLSLPGDDSFRSAPPLPQSGGPVPGAVTARPPTDPPPRLKPKPAEGP